MFWTKEELNEFIKTNKPHLKLISDLDKFKYQTKVLVLYNDVKYNLNMCTIIKQPAIPRLTNAVDKKEAFTILSNKKHSNRYTYDDVIYVGDQKHVLVTCSIHGNFDTTPNNHLNGYGCSKCNGGRKKTLEEFILKSNEVHYSKYNYSKAVYTRGDEKLQIICNIHGIFDQAPSHHLLGSGCPDCAWNFTKTSFINSCTNKKGILYVIRCFNENENFYKIGITSRSIKIRFANKKSFPYHYEVIQEIFGEGHSVYELEKLLHKIAKTTCTQYTPLIYFPGRTECFVI